MQTAYTFLSVATGLHGYRRENYHNQPLSGDLVRNQICLGNDGLLTLSVYDYVKNWSVINGKKIGALNPLTSE
jgi:hypothetical protein